MSTETEKRIELGKMIRRKREERGYSQRQLCRIANCSNTTLCHIENGNSNPQYDVILKIASALNVPIEELISGNQRIESCKESDMEIPQEMKPEVSYVIMSGKTYLTIPVQPDIITQMQRIIEYNDYIQKYVKNRKTVSV